MAVPEASLTSSIATISYLLMVLAMIAMTSGFDALVLPNTWMFQFAIVIVSVGAAVSSGSVLGALEICCGAQETMSRNVMSMAFFIVYFGLYASAGGLRVALRDSIRDIKASQ